MQQIFHYNYCIKNSGSTLHPDIRNVTENEHAICGHKLPVQPSCTSKKLLPVASRRVERRRSHTHPTNHCHDNSPLWEKQKQKSIEATAATPKTPLRGNGTVVKDYKDPDLLSQ